MNPQPDPAAIRETFAALERQNGNLEASSRELGLSRAGLRARLAGYMVRGITADNYRDRQPRQFETPDLPSEVPNIGDILDRRRKIWKYKSAAEDARKLVNIKVNVDGPIGLAIFGDIHIDNPGCNLPLLEQHTELVKKTDAMFACHVGDLQDSWIGRLARLWAQQGVTAAEARELCRWWLGEISDKLLFLVWGNHDAWNQGIDGTSAVDWIAKLQGTLAEGDGIRVALDLPSGKQITINCRHDMRGRSMYNAAHGVTKAALFGWRDDLLLAGHTHQFGYNPIKDPLTGRVSHPVRVASYKWHDQYAKQQGFPDENISECPVALIFPDETDQRHTITIDFNPFRAARILKAERERWRKARPK